jgi:hypothetical protein
MASMIKLMEWEYCRLRSRDGNAPMTTQGEFRPLALRCDAREWYSSLDGKALRNVNLYPGRGQDQYMHHGKARQSGELAT